MGVIRYSFVYVSVWIYLTNKSGCAKKSAYISNKDRLSRMKVGRTTCAEEEECETGALLETKGQKGAAVTKQSSD